MAYNELIKNFEKVRAYMREFYVYGFKSRTEYDAKSARSYDDERRRLESWLGDYMHFTQTPEGKNVFLSVDSRVTRKNAVCAGGADSSDYRSGGGVQACRGRLRAEPVRLGAGR